MENEFGRAPHAIAHGIAVRVGPYAATIGPRLSRFSSAIPFRFPLLSLTQADVVKNRPSKKG
jgi:hypothetical protein